MLHQAITYFSFAKAHHHYNLARQLLQKDTVALLSEAAKQLLVSASIMEYLHEKISTRQWLRKFSTNANNPIEVSADFCMGLGEYFRGMAQAAATMKAISNASSPTSIKCRLSIATANYCQRALQALDAAGIVSVNRSLLLQVATTREIFRALARFYQAQQLHEKKEIGNTLSALLSAKVRTTQRLSINDK